MKEIYGIVEGTNSGEETLNQPLFEGEPDAVINVMKKIKRSGDTWKKSRDQKVKWVSGDKYLVVKSFRFKPESA